MFVDSHILSNIISLIGGIFFLLNPRLGNYQLFMVVLEFFFSSSFTEFKVFIFNPCLQAGEKSGSVRQQLSKLFKESLRSTIPDDPNIEPLIAISQKFDDYQW